MTLEDIIHNINASINHIACNLRTEQPFGSQEAMIVATAALGIGSLLFGSSLLFGGLSLAAQLVFYSAVTCYSLEALLCKSNVVEEIKQTITDLFAAFKSVEEDQKFFREYIAGSVQNRISFVKKMLTGKIELHSFDSLVSTVVRAALGYLGFIAAQAFMATAVFSTFGLAINVAIGACLACSTAYALNLCLHPDDWNKDIDAFTTNTSLLEKVQMLIQGPINNIKRQLGFIQRYTEIALPEMNTAVNAFNSEQVEQIIGNLDMGANTKMVFSLAQTIGSYFTPKPS